MNKKAFLWVLLDSVFIVVFNVVFFLLGGSDHPTSVWLSYAFILLSYMMVLLTPALTKKSSSASVFGVSIYSVSATYFFVEFIVGLVFILLKQDELKYALVVQIIIAGLYAIVLLSILISNEETAASILTREEEVDYIKCTSTQVKYLIGRTTNKKAEKALEKVYDALHASPSKSNEEAKPIEEHIYSKLNELTKLVGVDDDKGVIETANDIIKLVDERNFIVKR